MYTIDTDIWQDQRLLAAPRTSMFRWQVVQFSYGSSEPCFFIGHCPSLGETEVSDVITSFNPFLGLGLGKFGEIYQLEGKPGGDPKVSNMLRKMLRAMPGSEYRNLTKQCNNAMATAAVLAQKMRDLSTLQTIPFRLGYDAYEIKVGGCEKHREGVFIARAPA